MEQTDILNERNLATFINVLSHSVDYDKIKNVHWLGITILTNQDMHYMLINKFGRDYELMTNSEQRKLREKIFRELRGN